MAKREKVPVTMRAVIQRINRKLAKEDEVLKAARSAKMQQNVGAYYIVDVRVNCVARKYINPEIYARELGVLNEWEAVRDA